MRVVSRLVVPLVAVPLLLPATAVPAQAAAAPANDAFAAAQVVSGLKGVAYGTLVGATIENSPPNVCNEPRKSQGYWGDRSVWYRWKAPTTGWLRFGIKTYGGWTSYVDAYRSRGSCWDDSSSGGTSSAPAQFGQVSVARGETLWFGVYSYGSNVGSFAFGWREIPEPSPLNDHFDNATVLAGRYGATNAANINATRQPGEPAHAGRAGSRSVWWRWTAPATGPAKFHVGTAMLFDCQLAVYTGPRVDALTPVAADAGQRSGDFGSTCTARFRATAGTTYAVAVAGERGPDAPFFLTWNSGPAPPHDTLAAARAITGFAGALDDTNRGATDESLDQPDQIVRSGSTVWYRWTAPDDGRIGFHIATPPLYQPQSPWEEDKRLAVFRRAPDGTLTLVGASEEPPAESVNVWTTVTAGTTLWVQVSGIDHVVTHYTFVWGMYPQTNDEFAEPVALPATGSVVAETEMATAEPGEPTHSLGARYPARRSLWFRWTAPTTGTITFDDWEHDDGFFAQPALAVYTGTSLPGLTRVPVTHEFQPQEWNTWRFHATAGTTYRIALDTDDPHGHGYRHRLNWYYGAREWTAPTVAMTAPPAGVVSGVVTMDATASDDSGVWSVGYSHDNAASTHFGPQVEPPPYGFAFDTERYADGPVAMTVHAWDIRGNRGTSGERVLNLQNRRPDVRSWWHAPDQLTHETSAHMEWEATEPLAGSMCSLDGGPYVDCSGARGARRHVRELAGLSPGVHVFRVRLTDLFGVQSAHPPAYQWVIDVAGLGVLLPDDTTAPVVSGPVPDIYGGHPPGDTTTAVRLRWTARDTTTAVQRLDMQMSVNGGAWKAMPTFGAETARIYELAGGRSYRFRVRAWDWAGNVSAWAYGPTFRVTVAQETHSAWRWSSGWSRIALAHASGGYVRITSTRGASARLTFRGRSVAIYGPKRPSLGLSAVYLDGVRVGTINQYAGSPEARATLFVRNGLSLSSTHSLRIKSLGARGNPSGGTRVAVDVVSVVR